MDFLGNFSKFYSKNSRLETRREFLISLFSRPRRDRDFYEIIFRDRDETETRNLDREIQEIETETRVSSNSALGLVQDAQSHRIISSYQTNGN